MNYESSKTSDPYRLLLNLSDKINFISDKIKEMINMLLNQDLAFTIHGSI